MVGARGALGDQRVATRARRSSSVLCSSPGGISTSPRCAASAPRWCSATALVGRRRSPAAGPSRPRRAASASTPRPTKTGYSPDAARPRPCACRPARRPARAARRRRGTRRPGSTCGRWASASDSYSRRARACSAAKRRGRRASGRPGPAARSHARSSGTSSGDHVCGRQRRAHARREHRRRRRARRRRPRRGRERRRARPPPRPRGTPPRPRWRRRPRSAAEALHGQRVGVDVGHPAGVGERRAEGRLPRAHEADDDGQPRHAIRSTYRSTASRTSSMWSPPNLRR